MTVTESCPWRGVHYIGLARQYRRASFESGFNLVRPKKLIGGDRIHRNGQAKCGESYSSATRLLTSGLPYLSAVFGAAEATSFRKRGSFRSGSNIGSSRSSAGVSGMFPATPAYGIESSFCKAAMARSRSPVHAATRARI